MPQSRPIKHFADGDVYLVSPGCQEFFCGILNPIRFHGLGHNPGRRVHREVDGPHSGPYRSRSDRRVRVRNKHRWPKR